MNTGHVEIKIRRSRRRRTVALRVTREAVTLLAPFGVPEADLRRWADEKRGWIEKVRANFEARTPPVRSYADGEAWPLLGETLVLRRTARRDVARVGDTLEVPDRPAEQLRPLVEAWYGREALDHFGPLAREMAARLGAAPSAVKLTQARTRWGSCTARGELRFNPRVLLAPPEVAAYLCAHEVAHLRELNHSAKFWALVEAVLPGHAPARRWLKDEGWRLVF